MDILIYVIFLLGSYSIGYGLIRAGFPKVQKRKFIEKIALGYFGGLILFASPFLITTMFNLKDTYYPLVCLIIFFILLLTLILKRTILNESEELTKAEQIELDKLNPSSKNYSKPVNYDELIKATKEINEEEIQSIDAKSASKNKISFDQGLMVKSRKREGQVFKEENKNIISQVNNETKKLEKTQSEEQKNSMLAKLREYAQEINNPKKEDKAKKKTAEDEDSANEEELLNMFKDEEM